MTYKAAAAAVFLVLTPLAAHAQQAPNVMPANGVFVGAGGAFNGATFPNQDIYGFGISNVYRLDHWVASGAAGGSVHPNLGSDTSVSPVIQGGFYRSIVGTPFLWGAKFSYNELGLSASQENVLIPQAGGYTGLVSGSFDGNFLLRSYDMSIKHQFALVPFVGYSFGKGYVYGGAGPTLSRITSNMNGLIGFAQLPNQRYDISGVPASFSASNWVWGGTVTAGVTYFFSPSWFLDLNYSYTASTTVTNTFATKFATTYPTMAFDGLEGGTYSGTANTQALALTVNYVF